MRSDDADSSTSVSGDLVQISVPARTEFLQLLRLNVAGVAADTFNVDEIDDLKIAVEELAALLIALPDPAGSASVLTFDFVVAEDRLVVSGRRPVAGAVPDPDEFLTTILDAVVDAHSIGTDGAATIVRFEKRARGE